MKKLLALLMAAVLLFGLAACGGSGDDNGENTGASSLKVGAILIGDETEGYTLAHMNGIEAAAAALEAEGATVTIEYKKKIPEDTSVETNANNLIASGCDIIITNSYGHQFNMGTVIEDNPDITFVSMTGDLAASAGLPNYVNAFTDVYESRYISGVIAGTKLKALLDSGDLNADDYPNAYTENGAIKVGYVGAFNYAEVVSGYTAFYLGIKSVVENVEMIVKYTNSWFSEEREAAVGEYLLEQGCVIIGQHADSTGAPAAVQKAHAAGTNTMCFSVGYNVSMLDVAPDVALTSASNNWEAYYETLFRAVLEGKQVPQDWSEGYSEDAVCCTELGVACAEGTKEAADAAIAAIKDGSLKVFDCSKFTVDGKNLTTYTAAYGMNGAECIKTENGVTYFDESVLRSAPYFDIRIDGITEIASDYEAE
ncbi:MAG: BMP family ABC transporter substrate-binding protein [Clostridia bacterium]|nr:BMP family ABC transporter substrate-binding protein [Clostridia bacterium]